MKIILIGVFGLIGVYLRYWISTIDSFNSQMIPLANLIANSIGCLIAGYLFYKFQNSQSLIIQASLIGLCGALTTFSSLNLELFSLLQKNLYLKAFLYYFISLTTGVILFGIGYFLSSRLNPNNLLHS